MKCYFIISDNSGEYAVTMTLDGCMEWIKNDTDNYSEDIPEDERAEYTLTPVWMTEDEFHDLPEADI